MKVKTVSGNEFALGEVWMKESNYGDATWAYSLHRKSLQKGLEIGEVRTYIGGQLGCIRDVLVRPTLISIGCMIFTRQNRAKLIAWAKGAK